jgi:hypothetical protein
MSSRGDHLAAAIAAVHVAVLTQADDLHPAHEDFHAWGYALSELTYRLAGVCRTLEQQVASYGHRRLLADDDGGDPYQRLADMRRLLADLSTRFDAAGVIAHQYHAEAGHLGVEVDPDAPAGPA